MNMLLLRALVAFVALPGIVAFVVPLFILRGDAMPAGRSWLGSVVLGIGIAALGWCIVDFYRVGRGTLAPWSPPAHLVVVGLYRFSRNPMYLSVLCTVAGWAILFRSRVLFLYALALLIAFHLRVVFGEEPWLARKHGRAWQDYTASVPRWIGRVRRNRGPSIPFHSRSAA